MVAIDVYKSSGAGVLRIADVVLFSALWPKEIWKLCSKSFFHVSICILKTETSIYVKCCPKKHQTKAYPKAHKCRGIQLLVGFLIIPRIAYPSSKQLKKHILSTFKLTFWLVIGSIKKYCIKLKKIHPKLTIFKGLQVVKLQMVKDK